MDAHKRDNLDFPFAFPPFHSVKKQKKARLVAQSDLPALLG
jgi:hypothetical protein